MGTRPSFGTLFRQSRYNRNDTSGQAVTRQNRQELFAVAAVAFLLEHDAAFRRTFWQKICGVTGADLDCPFAVEVQPASHADLRLTCAETKTVCIVEFKLGAHLQPKQDPTKYDAFMKPGSGYGAQILADHADHARRIYTVLQNWPTFEEGDVQGISAQDLVVFSRQWKDLFDPTQQESSLTRDLLDLLGGWGITALKFRHHLPMKKANHVQDTVEMFQIVTAVIEHLGIKPQHFDFDVQSGDGSHGTWFGLNVPLSMKQYTKLESVSGPGEDTLGWFGYSSDEGTSTLDVWVYCKPSKAVVTPAAKTVEFVRKRLGIGFVGTVAEAEGSVRISVGGDGIPDDRQWFAGIFDALRDKAA